MREFEDSDLYEWLDKQPGQRWCKCLICGESAAAPHLQMVHHIWDVETEPRDFWKSRLRVVR